MRVTDRTISMFVANIGSFELQNSIVGNLQVCQVWAMFCLFWVISLFIQSIDEGVNYMYISGRAATRNAYSGNCVLSSRVEHARQLSAVRLKFKQWMTEKRQKWIFYLWEVEMLQNFENWKFVCAFWNWRRRVGKGKFDLGTEEYPLIEQNNYYELFNLL